MPKTIKAGLSCGELIPFCQTKNNAMPISRNRPVQTGPKSQFGGLKIGFLSDAYQVGIERVVKIEPITPANWQMIILPTNFNMVIDFISLMIIKMLLSSITINYKLR